MSDAGIREQHAGVLRRGGAVAAETSSAPAWRRRPPISRRCGLKHAGSGTAGVRRPAPPRRMGRPDGAPTSAGAKKPARSRHPGLRH